MHTMASINTVSSQICRLKRSQQSENAHGELKNLSRGDIHSYKNNKTGYDIIFSSIASTLGIVRNRRRCLCDRNRQLCTQTGSINSSDGCGDILPTIHIILASYNLENGLFCSNTALRSKIHARINQYRSGIFFVWKRAIQPLPLTLRCREKEEGRGGIIGVLCRTLRRNWLIGLGSPVKAAAECFSHIGKLVAIAHSIEPFSCGSPQRFFSGSSRHDFCC
mmetsp:Transcript_21162/g.31025  ORF Transcript_21162/g.31025 Transcript_21162/m.31025 type:complete len:221 (-) Transcript_21162:20-682(-)